MKNATCKMQRNLAFKNACKSIHICCFEKHAWEQGKLLIKSTHTIVYNKVHVALCIHHRHYFPKSKGASRNLTKALLTVNQIYCMLTHPPNLLAH